MKVMETSLKYLSMVGIVSQGLNCPTIELWKTFRVCVIFAVYAGPILGGSLIFIFRHPNDFGKTISAYMVISGASAAIGAFLSFCINNIKIKRLKNEYQILVDTGNDISINKLKS